MEHALIQPSSAARWVQCPASVSLEAMFPESDSDASAEGTLAHSVVAAMLGHGKVLPGVVTEEMQDGAEMMFDHVTSIAKGLNVHINPVVEKRVSCTDIHADCWGTPDVRMTDVALNQMHIWDYKFGHRHVEVEGNWQLLCYAIGAIQQYGKASTDTLMLHLHIVQPRSYHKDGPIRTWVVPAADLWSYASVLREAAAKTMLPTPVANVGAECRDCKARHACATLQTAAYDVVQMSGKSSVFELTPEALGRELAVMQSGMEVLKSRIGGLENEVMATIKGGSRIQGWMLEQGSGRKKWDRPIEEIIALGELMGINVNKPAVITPVQAVKAGIPEAVVSGYTITPHGEIKLVRDTGAQARKVFNVT